MDEDHYWGSLAYRGKAKELIKKSEWEKSWFHFRSAIFNRWIGLFLIFSLWFGLTSCAKLLTGEAVNDTSAIPVSDTPVSAENGLPIAYSSVPAEDFQTAAPQEVLLVLFHLYLDQYQTETTPTDIQIADYKIDDFSMDASYQEKSQEQQVSWIARVTFSILPAQSKTNWMAGNGKMGTDGWIHSKALFIGYSLANDRYQLKIIGTEL